LNRYAASILKKVTSKNTTTAYRAINNLMHFENDKHEIIESISQKKAVDAQREFQLYVARQMLVGNGRNIGKEWDQFNNIGSVKRDFIDKAQSISQFYWPIIYSILSDALASEDFIMETEDGDRKLKHTVLRNIVWSIEQNGESILEYFEKNVRDHLPKMLVGKQPYMDEAIKLAGYFFTPDDSNVIDILKIHLENSGRTSVVKLVVYDNPHEIQESFVESNEYLEPAEVEYANKELQNYRREKLTGTRDLGRVEFTPTGLLDKENIKNTLERIKSNG